MSLMAFNISNLLSAGSDRLPDSQDEESCVEKASADEKDDDAAESMCQSEWMQPSSSFAATGETQLIETAFIII